MKLFRGGDRSLGGVELIRVAVLVTAGTRPKDLSVVLDAAFQFDPEILQFAVEGWPPGVKFGDFTAASLMEALARNTAERLTEDEEAPAA